MITPIRVAVAAYQNTSFAKTVSLGWQKIEARDWVVDELPES
jgi:hypothetical protein